MSQCWAIAYLLWAAGLYLASSLQGVPGPEIPHLDKVQHALFFAAGHLVLGIAIATWLKPALPSSPRAWWKIGILLVLVAGTVGVLDEFHQSFTPGRNGNDPGDIAADILGGTIAAIALPTAWRQLQRFLIEN
ncbi:MAG: VanZ family protein [Verrucomicrobiales bacterium]|jgi:VanZ family protein